jgi:methylated-DNA-[protein]-cysteine S-methyltransferase
VLEAPRELDQARRELDLYFEGRLDSFDLPLDWQLSEGFRLRVLHAIAAIPYGQTRTYTEMATTAGNERAVRAAGTACGRNPLPLVVPCHRVLRSGGALGGYGGGLPMKQGLLELEGVLNGE